MEFRSESMPGEISPAGPMSGFDAGLQMHQPTAMPAPYRPMLGRADKHASNIVGGESSGFHTGISNLRGMVGK